MDNRFIEIEITDSALDDVMNTKIVGPGNELIEEHNALNTSAADHIADADIHVTAEKQEAWDAKVNNSDYVKSPGYATATGLVNTYAVTLDPVPTAYTDGMGLVVKINVQNTGASTINVNGLGAKSILDGKGNTMTAGKLKAGTPYTLRYNGTNFILQGEGASGDATASDLYSGKTASVDAGDIVGSNPYKASVKVPFTKIKPAGPIQVASFDATNSTYNQRMSIVFVTPDGYSFMIQYYGSANSVMVYNKDGVYLTAFSISLTAIYDFLVYNGYIYAFSDSRVEKYSVNEGFTTITSVTGASIQNDYYRVKRIGDYAFYVKSSYMFNLNLNTLVYTQMIYKAGLSRFYAVDINNNLWGGNGYYTNVFKYDIAGNLLLTLSLSTALYASPSYMSIDYSVSRGTMIFICFKEVSGVRKYFLLEYSLGGALLNSVDLYTLYGIGGSASLYVDTYFGISNGLILFSCEKRLVAIKESDLSLVTRLPAGSFDCTETKAVLNGDYITGSMGNVHFCSSLVAELQ